MRFILVFCLLVLSPLTLHASTAEEVETLVKQLGSEHFKDRDRAERALLDIGSSAEKHLQPHKDSADPEVRYRVRRILKNLPPDVVSFLKGNKSCAGQASEGETVWPCTFNVTSFDQESGTFTGTLEWTSLNALHEIKGSYSKEVLTFKETDFIRKGNAVINVSYTFDLTGAPGGTLKGTWVSETGRSGPSELYLIPPEKKPEELTPDQKIQILRGEPFGGADPFGGGGHFH